MYLWVYSPSRGDIIAVTAYDDDPEKFAQEWCTYFPEDIYFFAELVPL